MLGLHMDAASLRRAARANWEIDVQRPEDDAGKSDDDDCRFWLRVPVAERAALTWDLSRELFELAALNGGAFDEAGVAIGAGGLGERRLPRAAFRVRRG